MSYDVKAKRVFYHRNVHLFITTDGRILDLMCAHFYDTVHKQTSPDTVTNRSK